MQQARLALMTCLFPRYRLVNGLIVPLIQSINALIIKMIGPIDFVIADTACKKLLRTRFIILVRIVTTSSTNNSRDIQSLINCVLYLRLKWLFLLVYWVNFSILGGYKYFVTKYE